MKNKKSNAKGVIVIIAFLLLALMIAGGVYSKGKGTLPEKANATFDTTEMVDTEKKYSFEEVFDANKYLHTNRYVNDSVPEFKVTLGEDAIYFVNDSGDILGTMGISESDRSKFLSAPDQEPEIPEDVSGISSTNFESAKKAVLNYVEKEYRLTEEDKKAAKEALAEARLYNGVEVEWYADEISQLAVYTYEGNVYLLNDIADDEYVFIHECIHIIADAIRQKVDYCQHGMLEEAMTEIIAKAICLSQHITSDKMDMAGYNKITSMAYALSIKFDTVDAYFHGYEKIEQSLGKAKLQAIALSFYTLSSENGFFSNSYRDLLVSLCK